MSALPCGCDKEAAWMCKRHLEESLNLSRDHSLPPSETVKRFIRRLADEDTMRGTVADAREPQQRINALNSAHAELLERAAHADTIDTPAVRIVAAAVDLLAERQRIAKVLAQFYRAELSMSSVQPILALALELNPDLVERAR